MTNTTTTRTDAATPAFLAPAPVAAPPAAPAPEVAVAPEASPNAWQVDLPLPAAPGKPAARKPEVLDLLAEHRAADKNKDGKLSRKESKLTAGGFKAADRNKDGKLTYQEQRAHVDRKTSFQGLDSNRDGKLSAEEMTQLTRRFDDRSYDTNQDGVVDRAEYVTNRREELAANREARRERDWKRLTKAGKQKLKHYDTDKDGQLSLEEFNKGRGADWRKGQQRRINAVFKSVAGGKGVVQVAKAKAYRAYDSNKDGKVTRGEFAKGAASDYSKGYEQRLAGGVIQDERIQQRLFVGKNGRAKALPTPGPTYEKLHANRHKWFISQYPGVANPAEDAPGNGNCGPTSLTMAAWALGAINPKSRRALDAQIEKSRAMMGFGPNEYAGTSSEGIAAGARKYGLDARVRGDASIKTIEEELRKGRVVIVNTSTYHLSGRRGGGHFSVVTAVKDGKVYLNDSARSAPMVVDAKTYMESIRDKGFYHMVSIGKKP